MKHNSQLLCMLLAVVFAIQSWRLWLYICACSHQSSCVCCTCRYAIAFYQDLDRYLLCMSQSEKIKYRVSMTPCQCDAAALRTATMQTTAIATAAATLRMVPVVARAITLLQASGRTLQPDSSRYLTTEAHGHSNSKQDSKHCSSSSRNMLQHPGTEAGVGAGAGAKQGA